MLINFSCDCMAVGKSKRLRIGQRLETYRQFFDLTECFDSPLDLGLEFHSSRTWCLLESICKVSLKVTGQTVKYDASHRDFTIWEDKNLKMTHKGIIKTHIPNRIQTTMKSSTWKLDKLDLFVPSSQPQIWLRKGAERIQLSPLSQNGLQGNSMT